MSPNFKNIIANLDKNKQISYLDKFFGIISRNKFGIIIGLISILTLILNFNIYISNSLLHNIEIKDDIQIILESQSNTYFDNIIKVDINLLNKNKIHFNTINLSIKFDPQNIQICDQSGSTISYIYNNFGNAIKNEVITEKNIGFINLHTISYDIINNKELNIGYFYIKPINETNYIDLKITNASLYIFNESKVDANIDKKNLSISIIKDIKKEDRSDKKINDSLKKINKEIQGNITTGPISYNTDKNNYIPTGVVFNNKKYTNDVWFVDIYGHWAMNDIIKLKKNNIIIGEFIGDNLAKFYPDQYITKGDFLYLLLKAFKINIINIDDTNEYNNIIYTAKQLNLIDDNFNQYDKLNKIEALELLYKLSIPIYFDKDRYIIYKDIKKTDEFSELVSWAIDRKIDKIIAYNSDKFYPYNNITRAEAAKLISVLRNF